MFLLHAPSGRTRGFLRFTKSVRELVDVPLDVTSAGRTPNLVEEELSKLRIGVVGLGSLGSRVVLSLARTGARRFVLVDGDLLEGPNLCRFPASFADVGATKADLVKELLRDACPAEPEVVTHAVHVGGATNPVLHARVLESLATTDLLINATANPDAFGLLAMIASDHRIPLVWGEVFGGGLGGLVAYADPHRGPCPRCVRAGILATTQGWPPAPGRSAAEPYAAGETAPVIATDADVAAIGAMVTQRVLDIARNDVTSPAATILGFRRGWVFDAPLQSIAIHVRSDDWSCPRCWRAAADPDPDLAQQAEGLFSMSGDADDSPAS